MGRPGYFARLTTPGASAQAVLMPANRPAPAVEAAGFEIAPAMNVKGPVSEAKHVGEAASPPKAAHLEDLAEHRRPSPGSFRPIEPVGSRKEARVRDEKVADGGALIRPTVPKLAGKIAGAAPKVTGKAGLAVELPSIFMIPPADLPEPADVAADVGTEGKMAEYPRPSRGVFRPTEPAVSSIESRLRDPKMAEDAPAVPGLFRPAGAVDSGAEKAADDRRSSPGLIRPTGPEPSGEETARAPVVSIGVIEVRTPPPPPPAPQAAVRAAAPAAGPKNLARGYGSAFGFGQS